MNIMEYQNKQSKKKVHQVILGKNKTFIQVHQ